MDTKKLTALVILLILVLNLLHMADARKKRKLCRLRKRRGNPVCVDRRVKVKMGRGRKGRRLRLCASTVKEGTCELRIRNNGRYKCRCVEKIIDH